MPRGASALLVGLATITSAQNPPAPPPPASQAPPAAVENPPAATPVQNPAPMATPSGTVVIDPGHGGADAGARGSGGVQEKDVVMSLAQHLRNALERQGLRVVMTRHAGDNPSYDDRAATANAYRGALVIALHASSTGTPGTARAYFTAPSAAGPSPVVALPASPDGRAATPLEAPAPRPLGLVRWEEAQQPHVAASRQFAAAVQKQIRQKLEPSPPEAAAASLRDLRSIAAPAIAVELSSVSVKDRKAIERYLAPLAEAIALGVRAYRGGPASGGVP